MADARITARTGGSRAAKSTAHREIGSIQGAIDQTETTKQEPVPLPYQEALETPAMEVHLGETYSDGSDRCRVCIIWINGRRWQGLLLLEPAGS